LKIDAFYAFFELKRMFLAQKQGGKWCNNGLFNGILSVFVS